MTNLKSLFLVTLSLEVILEMASGSLNKKTYVKYRHLTLHLYSCVMNTEGQMYACQKVSLEWKQKINTKGY